LKVLGIMGSPRVKGNTDLLLDEALRGAKIDSNEVEKIVVDKLKISPCKEYYGCLTDGHCVIHDDMDNLYIKLIEADRLIVASPIFFYGITSQLKALVDRCQATWARKYVLKQKLSDKERKGAFIAVGATRGGQLFDGSVLVIKYFFKAIDIQYVDELLVRGIDKKGEIANFPSTLAQAFDLGAKLAKN
jgi:multimeric flavodoxin WrbA